MSGIVEALRETEIVTLTNTGTENEMITGIEIEIETVLEGIPGTGMTIYIALSNVTWKKDTIFNVLQNY